MSEPRARGRIEVLHLVVVTRLTQEFWATAPFTACNVQANSIRINNWASVSSRGHLLTPLGILLPTADDRVSSVLVEIPLGVGLFGEMIRLLQNITLIPLPIAKTAATPTQREPPSFRRGRFGIGVVRSIVRGGSFLPRRVAIGVARYCCRRGRPPNGGRLLGSQHDVAEVGADSSALHVTIETRPGTAHTGQAKCDPSSIAA